ncbi:unnamed protein product [Notodromas monacha]|uniref:JmjC domain-containing protein n=1 Tax=Notodromas monacha TaxID=399045 RepID=A0A7R9GGM1_9CRUS|nr:unnamed protein product [Notodromas monacha]CAG0920350.1 unnamed protein product [Notodromas monacha]
MSKKKIVIISDTVELCPVFDIGLAEYKRFRHFLDDLFKEKNCWLSGIIKLKCKPDLIKALDPCGEGRFTWAEGDDGDTSIWSSLAKEKILSVNRQSLQKINRSGIYQVHTTPEGPDADEDSVLKYFQKTREKGLMHPDALGGSSCTLPHPPTIAAASAEGECCKPRDEEAERIAGEAAQKAFWSALRSLQMNETTEQKTYVTELTMKVDEIRLHEIKKCGGRPNDEKFKLDLTDIPGNIFGNMMGNFDQDGNGIVFGINTPYFFLGSRGTVFPMHCEDMDLLSINLQCAGYPKYSIRTKDVPIFEKVVHLLLARGTMCQNVMRHKMHIFDPRWFRQFGIKPIIAIQHPWEFVVTLPKGYHGGFNDGFNINVAINYAVPFWIDYGLRSRFCTCNDVRIPMEPFVRHQYPEKYREWLTNGLRTFLEDGRNDLIGIKINPFAEPPTLQDLKMVPIPRNEEEWRLEKEVGDWNVDHLQFLIKRIAFLEEIVKDLGRKRQRSRSASLDRGVQVTVEEELHERKEKAIRRDYGLEEQRQFPPSPLDEVTFPPTYPEAFKIVSVEEKKKELFDKEKYVEEVKRRRLYKLCKMAEVSTAERNARNCEMSAEDVLCMTLSASNVMSLHFALQQTLSSQVLPELSGVEEFDAYTMDLDVLNEIIPDDYFNSFNVQQFESISAQTLQEFITAVVDVMKKHGLKTLHQIDIKMMEAHSAPVTDEESTSCLTVVDNLNDDIVNSPHRESAITQGTQTDVPACTMTKGTQTEPSSIRTANTQTNRYCPNLTTSATQTDLSDTLSSVEECDGCALSRNFVQFMKTKRPDVDAREVKSIETAKSTAEDCARCKLVMNLIINLLRFRRDDIVLFNLVMATQNAIKNRVQIPASADLGESNVAINEEQAGPAPCQVRRVIPSRMSKKRTRSSSSSRKCNSDSASMSECDEGMTNASKKKSVRCAKKQKGVPKRGKKPAPINIITPSAIRKRNNNVMNQHHRHRVFNRGEQQASTSSAAALSKYIPAAPSAHAESSPELVSVTVLYDAFALRDEEGNVASNPPKCYLDNTAESVAAYGAFMHWALEGHTHMHDLLQDKEPNYNGPNNDWREKSCTFTLDRGFVQKNFGPSEFNDDPLWDFPCHAVPGVMSCTEIHFPQRVYEGCLDIQRITPQEIVNVPLGMDKTPVPCVMLVAAEYNDEDFGLFMRLDDLEELILRVRAYCGTLIRMAISETNIDSDAGPGDHANEDVDNIKKKSRGLYNSLIVRAVFQADSSGGIRNYGTCFLTNAYDIQAITVIGRYLEENNMINTDNYAKFRFWFQKFVSWTTALELAKHVPFCVLKKLNLNLYTSKYFLRSSALSAMYTGPHAECSKNAESIEEISMPTSENSSASGICPGPHPGPNIQLEYASDPSDDEADVIRDNNIVKVAY